MTYRNETSNRVSRSGEDLLGCGKVEAADRLAPKEATVGLDRVARDATPGTPSGRDRRPVSHERVTIETTETLVNDTGDDPLDFVLGSYGSLDDRDGAGVVHPERIDTVHGVRAREASAVIVSGEDSGQRARVQHGSERRDRNAPSEQLSNGQDRHTNEAADQPSRDQGPGTPDFVAPRWLKVLAGCLVALIAAAIAFAVLEPIQVLPRLRLAPGYSLVDQSGRSFTSETVRGSVTLYSFTSIDCGEPCSETDETMQLIRDEVARSIDLGDTEFRQVTIVLDDDPTTSELSDVATRAGADGTRWSVVGGDATTIRNTVGSGFGRFYEAPSDASIRFDSGYILVDGAGVIRGDYRYQTLADDGEKIVRHIDILASELRYADGSAAVAYEAAHLFLCYP